MTALILCAALSVICVGTLALAQQDRRRAARELEQLRAREALTEGLLTMAGDVLVSQRQYTFTRDINVGRQTIRLNAENEAFKWPMDKLDEVTPVTLAHRTKSVTVDDLKTLASVKPEGGLNWPLNDCLRQLASPFGYASTTEDRPRELSPFVSTTKGGQVWRLRAVLGQHVREQLVRFTGDPARPVAVIIDNTYALREVPTCAL